MKKYNDKSDKFSDWSTKKLKAEAVAYHDTIYAIECYGVRDMIAHSGIILELEKRGIEPKNQLTF